MRAARPTGPLSVPRRPGRTSRLTASTLTHPAGSDTGAVTTAPLVSI